MQLRAFSIFFLISLSLTGCMQANSCSFSVPFPTLGSQFEYVGSGELALPSTVAGALVVDWESIDGSQPRFLDLPPSSTVTIVLAEAASDRLNLAGQAEPAVQATYWVKDPNHPLADAADEWVSLEDSSTIQTVGRRALSNGVHMVEFSSWGRPPLLAAALHWGHMMGPGETDAVRLPRLMLTASIDLPSVQPENVSWEVMRTSETSRGCEAELQAVFESGSQAGLFAIRNIIKTTWVEGLPMPVEYHAEHQGSRVGEEPVRVGGLDLVLSNWHLAMTEALPAFAARPDASTALSMAMPSQGFATESSQVFPTSYETAIAQVQANVAFQAWIGDHPDAKVISVSHGPGGDAGTPGLDVVDAWSIYWEDGYQAFSANVVARSAPLELGGTSYWVTTDTSPGEGRVPVPGPWPTTAAMVHAAQTHLGEVGSLVCDLSRSECNLNSINQATANGIQLDFGLSVWLEQGLVPKDQSASSHAIGDPVPLKELDPKND